MPNWCTNTLSICGPPDIVDDFIKISRSTEPEDESVFSSESWTIIDNHYPVPQSLKEVTSRFGTIADDDPDKEQKQKNEQEYGAVDWYEWCVTNWGTKWADCHTQKVHESVTMDDSLKKVMFRFDSAWSPPVEAFDTIAMLFPKLMFDLRYEEPGMCFQGFRIWGEGEQKAQADMDYMQSGDMAYDMMDWDYDDYVTVGEDNG
jgi:hypothetical protein